MFDRILKSAWPNNISPNIFTPRKPFIQWHLNVRISNTKICRWCLELSGSQLVEELTTRDAAEAALIDCPRCPWGEGWEWGTSQARGQDWYWQLLWQDSSSRSSAWTWLPWLSRTSTGQMTHRRSWRWCIARVRYGSGEGKEPKKSAVHKWTNK